MAGDWTTLCFDSFFFKVLFFPLAHGVRSGAPKLQISLAPLEKKSCRGDEMEKGLCQASWTRWRVNCLQMESCSTSEVGGEERLGAFKWRIEPGTRKLRGDGRDKEKMEKWTWEKKNLEEQQASGKGQIGGGEPDSRDQQQMDALLQHATQLGAKPRTGAQVRHCTVQCSGVECDGTGSRPPRAYGRERELCVCDCQGIRYY